MCYKKNTVTPSRYCIRFIIPTKLSNNLTTGYMMLVTCDHCCTAHAQMMKCSRSPSQIACQLACDRILPNRGRGSHYKLQHFRLLRQVPMDTPQVRENVSTNGYTPSKGKMCPRNVYTPSEGITCPRNVNKYTPSKGKIVPCNVM